MRNFDPAAATCMFIIINQNVFPVNICSGQRTEHIDIRRNTEGRDGRDRNGLQGLKMLFFIEPPHITHLYGADAVHSLIPGNAEAVESVKRIRCFRLLPDIIPDTLRAVGVTAGAGLDGGPYRRYRAGSRSLPVWSRIRRGFPLPRRAYPDGCGGSHENI